MTAGMLEVTDRAAAASARSAALGGAGVGLGVAESPRGVGNARSVPFPAQLRAKLEDRAGQELYHLQGVASVTDTPYEMWDMFGPYDEIVARRAFTETLAADPDVAFLTNHRGVTMARTTNGTLILAMSDAGLAADAWLNPKRQDVSDLVIAIDDKNIDEMSFAFMLEDGRWSEDFTSYTITKLSIHRGDVSAVNYGANPYTSIAARSREILADLDHLPAGAVRAAMARLASRTDIPDLSSRPVASQSDGVSDGSLEMVAAWLSIEN
jgi:HK97 family phage prohead protease